VPASEQVRKGDSVLQGLHVAIGYTIQRQDEALGQSAQGAGRETQAKSEGKAKQNQQRAAPAVCCTGTRRDEAKISPPYILDLKCPKHFSGLALQRPTRAHSISLRLPRRTAAWAGHSLT
jgi:hypothetical protein